MADRYTQEEMDAIAAFDGEIQKVPRGKSAVSIEGRSWLEGASAFRRRADRINKFALSRERDDTIRKMLKGKATISDMASATGLTRKAVKRRIERLSNE